MLTINAGGSNAIFLNAGQTLTVQGGPNSAGTVYKCIDSTGANSTASYGVGANSSQTIGPFGTDFIMMVYCSAGYIFAGETSGGAFTANRLTAYQPGMGGPLGIAPYLGIVATRCGCMEQAWSAGKTVAINRSAHIATEDISSMRVIYPAWTITQNNEANLDAASSATCYVEYPVDKYTQLTFGGSNTATATTAGENMISDFLSINIPRGAVFYLRFGFQFTGSTTNGMPTNGSMLPNWGAGAATGSYYEGIKLSAVPADLVLTGTKGTGGSSGNSDGFSTNFSNRWVPLAILGMTTRPTFFLAGDSITVGIGDAADGQLACGWPARMLGNKFGYFNAGASGESVQLVATANYAKRAYMAQYCSHVICAYGTNDISGGRTPAQCLADIATFRNTWFAGKRFYVCTVPNRTTSTDGFITEANQTVVAADANYALFNDQLRIGALACRWDGLIDIDQITQGTYAGRKWKAFGTTTNRMTADGTHPSPFGATYIASKVLVGNL